MIDRHNPAHVIILVVFFIVGCVAACEYWAEHDDRKYYSLSEHPLQSESWYRAGNTESFEYSYGLPVLAQTFQVERFYAQEASLSSEANRRGSTILQITANNQTRSYLVATEDLDNMVLPAQSAVVQLITSEYTNKQFALSLKPVNFQDTSELNIFDLE